MVVPIVFGRALLDPYQGFAQHTVARGDTLSGLARQWYGDPHQWPRIFEATRDRISNPQSGLRGPGPARAAVAADSPGRAAFAHPSNHG